MFSLRSLVLFALLPATVLCSVADVKAAIASIVTAVDKLNLELPPFNGSSPSGILQSLAIHNDTVQLDGVIKKATTDTIATPGPVTVQEGTDILQQVHDMAPKIIAALKLVVAKKPDFQAVPIGGVPAQVKGDIKSLHVDTQAFKDALIAKTPAELVPQAQALVAPIEDAFKSAEDEYKGF